MGMTAPRSHWAVQLRAILRKNWLLAVRNKRDTFREFGTPLLLLGAMVLLSQSLGLVSVPAVTDAVPRSVPSYYSVAGNSQLLVAPCAGPGNLGVFATAVAAALSNAGVYTTCVDCEAGCPRSVLSMWASNYSTIMGAVVFDVPFDYFSTGAPTSYRLRLDPDLAPGAGVTNSTSAYAADGSRAAPDTTPATYIANVMPLQAIVDLAIADVVTASRTVSPPPPFMIAAKAFPYPTYSVDIGSIVLSSIVPIYVRMMHLLTRAVTIDSSPTRCQPLHPLSQMTVIFSLLVRGGLTRILVEKETKIAISLRIASLSPALNLASWIITLALRQTVVVTVVVIVAVVGGIFPRSSISLLWVYFTLMELTVRQQSRATCIGRSAA